MAGIGPLELGIVLVIVLIVFGPKKLPGLGKQLGSGMREFKESISGESKKDDDDDRESDRPALTQARADEQPAEPSTTAERDDAVSHPRT